MVILALFALSSCGKYVVSDVTVFHSLPEQIRQKSFNILPEQSQVGDPEFFAYSQMVRAGLLKSGMVEKDRNTADYSVIIQYKITPYENVSHYPIYGQTGTSGGITTGTINTYGNTATYSSTTSSIPTFGVVGSGVSVSTEYTRTLTINMVDNRAFDQSNDINIVYKGFVISQGSGGKLLEIIPSMVSAIFEEFPGPHSYTRNVRIKQ